MNRGWSYQRSSKIVQAFYVQRLCYWFHATECCEIGAATIRTSHDGSRVREVPAGRFGSLTGWPEDFHDDSQRDEENILRVTGEEWEKVLGGSDLCYRGN